MARKSFVSQLTSEERGELNKLIRENLYSKQEDVLGWVKAHGHYASKSAVNRYCIALKASDGNNLKGFNAIATRVGSADGRARHEQILIELGRLKMREIELIDEYRDLVGRETAE